MKSSNRWAVMKDLDKSDDEIIAHSAKKAKNDGLYLEGKRYHNDSYRFNRYYKSFYN
jgi:hypothetical protein